MYIPKNTLLAILLSLVSSVFSQGGFRKKYFLQNSFVSVCGNVIEAPNGDLLMMGLTYDTLNGHAFNRLTLMGTDPNGNELWRKDYGNYNFEYLDGINKNSVVQDNNGFYLTLVVKDSLSKITGVLLKINYSGDTLWQKIYRDPNGDVMPQGITKSVDGALLITGCYQNTLTTLPILILKIDINGNELWRKLIHKPAPNFQICISIKQDTLTKRILTVGYQVIGNSFCSNILILDSLGNKILQTSFNNPDAGAFNDIIQLKDKNFVTTGAWKHSYSNSFPNTQCMLVKFDINGLIIWKSVFGEPGIYNRLGNVCELSNGDIITQGYSEDNASPVKLQIFKLDKNGNVKWKRNIGSTNNTYSYGMERSRSMNQIQDGGFILSSQLEQLPNPRPYSIIKIDSTACDTTEEWCRSVILDVEQFNELTGYNFELFPNPATEVVNIKIDAPLSKAFELKIADAQGRLLEEINLEAGSNFELHTSAYNSGLYFVNVIYEGKIVETKKLVVMH